MANEDGRRGQQLADQQQAEIDEAEVNSLRRSGSASPSTFSTASSGSPLVRNSSSSSAGLKRPAPTSIAAAQLQCQQQQIEFANRLAASGKKSSPSAKQSGGSSSRKAPNSLYGEQQRKPAKRCGDSKLSMSQSYGDHVAGHNNNNKGFGYNLAKSIAFKAYNFNEFKSSGKLRYMNLACLLLTLVCLVTILIFSGSNSGGGGGGETAASAARSKLYWQQQQLAATRKSLLQTSANGNGPNDNPMATSGDDDEDETSESVDSLDSQPLLAAGATSSSQDSLSQMDLPSLSSAQQHQQKPGADLEREFILSGEFERAPNVIDEPSSAPTGAQQTASAAATTTTTAPTEQQKSSSAETNSTVASDSKDIANRTDKEQLSGVDGLLNDPFLNSSFTRSELRSLSKLLRRSHGKPVTIKGKSGATITMRSSSNFDGSQLSSIPSFIEKQLQLNGFKPPASRHQAATIVGGIEAPNFVSSIRSGSFAALPPIRMFHRHHQQQPAELLMPEPISMVMAPMLEQMLRPSPLAMPSSLMRMIVRADGPSLLDERLGTATDDDEQQQPAQPDDLAQATFSRTVILPQASLTILAGGLDNANSNASNTNDDTLASQQKNSTTTTSPQQQGHAPGKLKSDSSVASHSVASSSSLAKQAANNSEVETFDVSHLAKPAPVEPSGKFHSFYPSRASSYLQSLPHSSSMIIFGPGESGEQSRRPEHSAFQLSPFGQGGLLPFMAPPFAMQPQIMMFGAGSPTDGPLDNQAQENPLYPILGSILNNVMADLSSLAHNKEERTKSSTINKNATAAGENNSRAHQQQSARHQALGSSLAPNWTAALSSGAADMSSKSSNSNNLLAASNDEVWSSGAGDSDSWDEHAQLQHNQQPTGSSVKQLKVRHGADVGLDLDSSGADAPAIASMAAGAINSRFFPSSGPMPLFGASMLSLPSGIVSGSIRQTIRGPGMTVERTIELPAARISSPAAATANTSGPKSVAQQVAEGVRSQSLRRADGGDSDSSADSISSSSIHAANMIGHHHHMFSPLGSLLVRHVNDRSAAGNGGDEFPPFPMAPVSHAFGRILSDLAQHQQQSKGAGRISIARSSPMLSEDFSDDLEEGDASSANAEDMFASLPTAHKLLHEGPPNGGQVRVASARFIMRPADSSAHESGLFLPPFRFAMPDTSASESNLERELSAGPNGSQEASERMMVVAPSFEDTLNSMEDRVNQVLSLSAQHMNSAAASMRPAPAASKPKQFHERSAGTQGKVPLLPSKARAIPPHFGQAPNAAISRSDLIARLESSLPNQQASGSSSINGNPFTSPSSPLFGFPTSSMASLLSDQQKQQQAEEPSGRHNNSNKPNENTSTGSFRQRKSFTYHSNNEPAGANQQKQQAELAIEDSNQQSVFTPFEKTPAALPSMIFGRRMDDIPEQFRVPQQTDVFLRQRDLELEPMS